MGSAIWMNTIFGLAPTTEFSIDTRNVLIRVSMNDPDHAIFNNSRFVSGDTSRGS
jgi:hypothetical protein